MKTKLGAVIVAIIAIHAGCHHSSNYCEEGEVPEISLSDIKINGEISEFESIEDLFSGFGTPDTVVSRSDGMSFIYLGRGLVFVQDDDKIYLSHVNLQVSADTLYVKNVIVHKSRGLSNIMHELSRSMGCVYIYSSDIEGTYKIIIESKDLNRDYAISVVGGMLSRFDL